MTQQHRTWPTLYKKTSTGASQVWQISVLDNMIHTRFGQVDGKLQETAPTVCVGKNAGKANETSCEQQAVLEAEAQWTKKLKKDYVLTLDAALKGESSDLIEGGILPQLAHKYSEQAEKITFPAYCQPKLDGHRCIAVVKNGKCTLWSRTRKAITGLPHIVAAVEALGIKNIVLDGELYTHELRSEFEKLTHFIRQSTVKPGHEIVHYYVYDIADNESPFCTRMLELAECDMTVPLVCVETVLVEDEDALMVAFERFLEQGYEGAMVRNSLGKYENKRSYNLQKVKQFDDAEFKVTDVVEGKGKMAGHGIFVCKTKDGTEFRAKMKGDHGELAKYYMYKGQYIGRQLTVKYQGLTNKAGVPRFPVALRFKD